MGPRNRRRSKKAEVVGGEDGVRETGPEEGLSKDGGRTAGLEGPEQGMGENLPNPHVVPETGRPLAEEEGAPKMAGRTTGAHERGGALAAERSGGGPEPT